jgi:hypothetical protein
MRDRKRGEQIREERGITDNNDKLCEKIWEICKERLNTKSKSCSINTNRIWYSLML